MLPRISYGFAVIGGGLVLMGTCANASSVYSGCSTPPASATGHVFYVDPINGSMNGDGSVAHPWHTLSEVVAAGLFSTTPTNQPGVRSIANPPIKPKDTVYLLTGNHGSVTLQGYYDSGLVGYANPDFITVEALPGQTPVLNQLNIEGASKWVFRGLTIQSTNNTGIYTTFANNNPDYYLVSLQGPHDNIILDNNKILSTPNVSGWAISDWVMKRASGVLDNGGNCIAVTNNSISNIGFGLQTMLSRNVIISNNTINYFSDDGIDYGSSNLLIQQNQITNSVEDGDGIHRDGMQGQPSNEKAVVENIVIKDNVIVRITDPNLPFPAYLQGIDSFDGRYVNLTIENNTIITDAWHGISYYGAYKITIENNIVLQDNGKVLPCGHITYQQCLAQAVIYDQSTIPDIDLSPSKAGVPTMQVYMRGNIATGVAIDSTTLSAQALNNLCVLTGAQCVTGMPLNGKMTWVSKPGSVVHANLVATFGPGGLFKQFDPVGINYNLGLKIPNPALSLTPGPSGYFSYQIRNRND